MSAEAAAPSRNDLRIRRIGAGFAIAAWTAAAPAGTASKDLSVTATVVDSCVIRSPPALAVGSYDPENGTNLATHNALISIACTQHAAPTVTLGPAVSPANGFTELSPKLQREPAGLDTHFMVVTVTF